MSTTEAPVRKIDVHPMPFPLGAEVRCGDLRTLDDEGKKALKRAWLDHLVILIRGQTLGSQDLISLAKMFGEIDRAAPLSEMPEGQAARFDPHISVVSNVVDKGVRIGSLGDGEVVWHSDHSYHEIPIAASMLFGVEIPPAGGRTGFLNMYQALDTLPAALQERLKTLSIKNDATYNSAGQIRRGMSPVTDVRTSPGVTHPAVRTNPETGHNALYLGRRPHAYVNGLTVEDSEKLLDDLWRHATSLPAWYHEWRVGDVVVWDNRCVMHRREPFDPSTRRVLHRAQTKGTRPELLATAKGRPHPRSTLLTGG